MVLGNIVGPDGLIVLIVVVLVMLFGGSKLPGLARSLGSASHEFRKGVEAGHTDKAGAEEKDAPKPD
jgi:sec-independent protein translocase protein TatA